MNYENDWVNMKTIELSQRSDEWLQWRKGKIGASDAPIIMNESPWYTPLQLWERKLNLSEEQPDNFAMSRGVRLEDEARQAFMALKRIMVFPEIVEHPIYEWMIASLDGLCNLQEFAVEIKCPGREDQLMALQGVVPKKYVAQLQHQLAVTGLPMIYYYSYDGRDNALIEVERDEKYIENLIKEELKFYKCMKTFTPPELSGRDYNIRNDNEWRLACIDWKEAHEKLTWWQDHEKAMREELIAASQSRNSKGFGVKVQKIMRQGAVQYSEIECLKEVDLDKYRKPASESWRITLDGS